MLLRLKNRMFGIFISVLAANIILSATPGQAKLRKLNIDDKMPEFSLVDLNGTTFSYKHNRKRVLLIVFMSATQQQSKKAAADIKQVLADLSGKSELLDFFGVMSESPKKDFLEPDKGGPETAFPILLDSKYKLWGMVGIVAMPTLLIVGKDDRVLWTMAGHGYDFAPALRSHLSRALGLVTDRAPEESVEVKTLDNAGAKAHMRRHFQMAKMLERKGRLDSAVIEVRKAQTLYPDSVEPLLELGELFCRAGKSKAALEAIEKIKAAEQLDKARLLMISGWAKRQMGDLGAAEKDLLGATKLNPESTRGYFELGQVFQAKGDKDKALAAYHRALTLVLGDS